MKEKPGRRTLRLPQFDYTQFGAYFITICIQNRLFLLGEINAGQMILSEAGEMVRRSWEMLPGRFSSLQLDYYVVMPNHFHGIVFINDAVKKNRILDVLGDRRIRPVSRPQGTVPDSVGRMVQAFKSITTLAYINGVRNQGWRPFSGKLWQRNYYEHIVRDEKALTKIREYIETNPLRWHLDRENPFAQGHDEFDKWLKSFSMSSLFR